MYDSYRVTAHCAAFVLCVWCSFAGAGLCKGPVDKLIDKVHNSRNARERWRRAKVLIIDEISMIDGDFFDKLEHIGRALNQNSRPFGGIQVIVSGALSHEVTVGGCCCHSVEIAVVLQSLLRLLWLRCSCWYWFGWL